MSWTKISKCIEKAHEGLAKESRPWVVYRRNGKVAALPLITYLDLNLDDKGAKRVCVVTKNARGEII
jgi:hypothetical protein